MSNSTHGIVTTILVSQGKCSLVDDETILC